MPNQKMNPRLELALAINVILCVVASLTSGSTDYDDYHCAYKECTCIEHHKLDCTSLGLVTLPALYHGADWVPKHRLDLSGNPISHFGADELPPGLEHLICNSCTSLKTIDDDAFIGWGRYVLEITVEGASMTKLPNALTKDFPLAVLRWDRRPSSGPGPQLDDAHQVSRVVWTKQETLEILSLSGHNLKINPVFRNMFKLRELNLGGNGISRLSYMLPISLRILYLYENSLTEIPRPVSELPQLRTLDLSTNNIQKLSPLPSTLTDLNLASNMIGYLDNWNLPNLVNLRLNNNKVGGYKNRFPMSLRFLDLRNNKLWYITEFYEGENHNLEELYLSDNPIMHIQNNAFSQLTQLKWLDIRNISIYRLPKVLKLLPKLEYLDVGHPSGVNDPGGFGGMTCKCQEAFSAPDFPELRAMTILGNCRHGNNEIISMKYYVTDIFPNCKEVERASSGSSIGCSRDTCLCLVHSVFLSICLIKCLGRRL